MNRLDELTTVQASLREADVDPTDAAALIESMEDQLNDLYRQKEEQQDAADQLAEIEEVPGISSLEDAVEMIQRMENQLADLYEDKEALQDLEVDDTEHKSIAQQLEALYADRQKLQRTLGISSADDVIEMIESLNSQLEDMYTGRDAEVEPAERHDARLWAPEPPSPDPADAPAEESESSEMDTLTMNSMEHQLEALYRERETLLHHGFSSAEEAVHRLQTQQRQIDALQRENYTYEQQLDRLESELGTRRVPRLVELVRTLESDANTSLDDLRPEPAASPESTDYGVDIGATSPFVDADTLDRLDDMTAEEIADLDVGAVRLREDGTVEDLNETALQLPGLQSVEDPTEVIGKNFFLDLAPSTNNNLFFGRFRKGQRRGKMDARFPYTFTSPEEGPQSFAVHLYRPSDSDATWLLFRPA